MIIDLIYGLLMKTIDNIFKFTLFAVHWVSSAIRKYNDLCPYPNNDKMSNGRDFLYLQWHGDQCK